MRRVQHSAHRKGSINASSGGSYSLSVKPVRGTELPLQETPSGVGPGLAFLRHIKARCPADWSAAGRLNLFPVAAVTNYHKLGDFLKKHIT